MVTLAWPDFAPHLELSNGGKEQGKNLAENRRSNGTHATPVLGATGVAYSVAYGELFA